jgi:nucleoside-diphosphate-sugar epimerase
MKKIVTGCSGFVGSHICESLLKNNEIVVGVDCFTNNYSVEYKKRNLEALQKYDRFQFIEGDLSQMELDSLIDGVDCIFHTAGQPGVRSSWGSHFNDYINNNILATQRLLESVKNSGKTIRFVYSSSSSVYGNNVPLPMIETVRPQPYSPYGTTKLAAEHLCNLYHSNYGVQTVSLRYFTVYGPRQRPDMGFHIFMKALLADQPIRVLGDGSQTRDFTYVADIVQANLLAAEKPVEGEIFNIGGGCRISLIDVLKLIEEVSGLTMKIDYHPVEKGDVKDTWADTSKATRLLGFEPRTSLKEGLQQEFDWIKDLYSA